MNGSPVRTGLLVVTLLIAGCSGPSPQPQPTVSVTPAPVPSGQAPPTHQFSTEKTQTATAFDDTETVDLVLLGRTHYRTVFKTSYTSEEVLEIIGTNGTVITRAVVVTAHNGTTQRVTIQRSDLLARQQVEREFFTSNSGPVMVRSRHGNGQTYCRLTYKEFYQRIDALLEREVLISYLVANSRNEVDPQLRQLREVDDGEGFYLFASQLDRPDRFNTFEPVGAPRNLSLWVDIDPAGFIRNYRLVYNAQFESTQVRVSRTVTYSMVGSTTIERPAWYDRAMTNDTSNASSCADR